jgi:hypothetical protein
MHIRGTIDPPTNTKGILFTIEGMGDGIATFLVEAGDGTTLLVDAITTEGEPTYLGFRSHVCIQRLTQVWAGSLNKVVLTGVWLAIESPTVVAKELVCISHR